MRPKLLAEFLGVFALCFVGIATVAHGGGGLVGAAIAHGLALGVMVTALTQTSGAHLNPAVTIAVWKTGRITFGEVLLYTAAQLAGSVVAVWMLSHLLPAQSMHAIGYGTPALGSGVTFWNGVLFEAILTLLLVVVLFTSVTYGGTVSTAGLLAGATYCAGILAAGPVTGGALNPARAFGPAFISGVWSDHGLYWIGPFLGAVVGAFVYERWFRKL